MRTENLINGNVCLIRLIKIFRECEIIKQLRIVSALAGRWETDWVNKKWGEQECRAACDLYQKLRISST